MNIREYIPFYKRNLNLAVPVMITQAGQMVVQFADNIMVGHVGTIPFAGVSFANTIIVIGMVFCICFSQGLTPHAGQNWGKGDYKEVAKYFANSFVLNTILSTAVVVLLYITTLFMHKMGQDEVILPYATSYLKITAISLIPTLMFFSLRNFSEAIGITKYAMYITIIANAINILLNWVFIYGNLGMPELGSDGAAVATLISRILSFILFALLVIKRAPFNRYLKLIEKNFISKRHIKELFGTSLPIALQGLVEVSTFSMAGIMVGWFGVNELAANQITHNFVTFTFMIAQGFGVAATIRVAHQYGERKFLETQKAAYAAIHLSMFCMAISATTYITFRNIFPFLFTNDLEVIAIASKLLCVGACFQIFDALQLACLASLRGLGDVKIPLYLSIFAYYALCIPFGYIIGVLFNLGPIGIWLGLALGLSIAGLTFFIRLRSITDNLINMSK